jgi:hypothetical protein
MTDAVAIFMLLKGCKGVWRENLGEIDCSGTANSHTAGAIDIIKRKS